MSKTKNNSIYFELIQPHINRVLGLMDSDPTSATYGCFDRNYWHYSLIDTPSVRFQEASLFLVLLYNFKHPDNIYYLNENIKSRAIAGIRFWQKVQHKDGSFDEWYPREQSFVATTFSLYAITESCLQLKYLDPSLLSSIEMAANWLDSRQEFVACNQHSGAIIALYNVWLITGNNKYKFASSKKLSQLLARQSSEGWFAEYGGADLGYSSVLVDYLGKYYLKSKDKSVIKPMEKLLKFMSVVSHPNGVLGGEYGSRNTRYVLPHGLEIFHQFKSARFLKNQLTIFSNNFGLNLDDRYLCNNGYTFLQAAMDENKLSKSVSRIENYQKLFCESGLFVKSTSKFFLIINLKKGVIKVFDKKQNTLIWDNSGVVMISNKGRWATSILSNKMKAKIEKNTIVFTQQFGKVTEFRMSSSMLLFSRIGGLFLSIWPNLVPFIKKYLRQLLITNQNSVPAFWQCSISWQSNSLQIKNTLFIDKSVQIDKVCDSSKHSLIYVPSSRLFIAEDANLVPHFLSSSQVDYLNKVGTLTYNQYLKLGK